MEKIKYEKLKRGHGADPLLYKQGETTPYTGIATARYKNGQIKFEAMYKNGTLHGKSSWWHRNGHKEYEATYKNGKISETLIPSPKKKLNPLNC